MSEMQLPDSWIWAKLGTITEIVGGGTPSRDNPAYFQGDILWVSPTDISKLDDIWIDHTAESISEKGLRNSSAVLLPIGSVLMTCRASFGLLAINLKEMCTSQSLYSFVCNKDLIFNEYLVYCLTSMRKRLAQLAGETTFKGISKSTLSRVEIPLPPLPEQRRIVAIVREAEEIRRLRNEANEKTQKIVEALFYDMFGDVNPEKDYPDDWRILPLKFLTTSTQYGISDSLKDKGDIGILRMNNITSQGWLDLNDIKFIISSDVDVQQYSLVPGDILFNRTNSKELVGKTALWEEGINEKFSFASYIIRVRLNTERVAPEYIWALLNSPYGKQQLFGLSKQAVNMANINTQELGSIKIVLPPLDEQRSFAAYVKIVREELKSNAIRNNKLNFLYQSLLSRAFTGELTAAWREEHAEELAQAARERDDLLQKQFMTAPETWAPERQIQPVVDERREDLVYQLSSLQKALLAIFRGNTQFYFTSYQFYEEYEEELQKHKRNVSLDLVRRELHTLAALGLVREVALPVTDQPGHIDYITVYRYPQPEDESTGEDLEYLTVRSL